MVLIVNLQEKLRLSEFACLVDAIPPQFRESILTAAIEAKSSQGLGSRPFVVGMREQLRECVHASIGDEVSNDLWEERALDIPRQCLAQFSECKDPPQVQLVLCELISHISECFLSSPL